MPNCSQEREDSCRMIFKSKYELYEFLLAPSPEGAFAGFQKKKKH